MDIFKERNFYPSETTIKQHYAGTFDSVFLAFMPFFRLDERHLSKSSFQRVHRITYPQFKAANPNLNLPESISGEIYTNNNPEYPSSEEILRFGSAVTWREVVTGCGFSSLAELNKALTSTIGGYRTVFLRQDLAGRLLNFAESERVFLPEEGAFDVFSKIAILNTFRKLGKDFIVVVDELLRSEKTIDIREQTEEEFCSKIEFKDYYLYDAGKELLFAVDWDDFFFLIATSSPIMERVLEGGSFEGFLCDDSTRVYWELGEEELQAGLAQEAKGNS